MPETTFEKFLAPVGALASVLAVYFWLKKPNVPAQSNNPNPSASGVPLYTPEAQQYTVNPPTLTPSPLVMLSDPFADKPAGTTEGSAAMQKPPYYLAFNLSPLHDLTKVPVATPDAKMSPLNKSAECGCGSCSQSCDKCDQTQAAFTDGIGTTRMSSNRRRQIQTAPPTVWEHIINNLQGTDLGPIATFQPTSTTVTPAAPAVNNPPSTPGGTISGKYVGKPLPISVSLGSHSFGSLGHVGRV